VLFHLEKGRRRGVFLGSEKDLRMAKQRLNGGAGATANACHLSVYPSGAFCPGVLHSMKHQTKLKEDSVSQRDASYDLNILKGDRCARRPAEASSFLENRIPFLFQEREMKRRYKISI
jgi:hypothetical protein